VKKISGKTRTRQHVIADLAVNHLERQVLLLGYTAQRIQHDYGYDLTITTYDVRGQTEGGVSFVQIKATDNLPLLKDGKTISWPVSRRDLKLWLNEQNGAFIGNLERGGAVMARPALSRLSASDNFDNFCLIWASRRLWRPRNSSGFGTRKRTPIFFCPSTSPISA
jgi:hypothetical protein